jgi:tRNA (guanine-N7-)-methyltransferase
MYFKYRNDVSYLAMRPRDLKASFKTFEERKPFLDDRVLTVPRSYDKHRDFVMPPLDSEEVFGRQAPIAIEFCSGNGEWIARMAEENPDYNWIAVERQYKRVRKIWAKMKNRGIRNLLIVCGNAEDFCEYYLSPGTAQKIYINFPDPWPKKRHAKNRLVQVPFAKQIAHIVTETGEAMIVTDDAPYSEQVLQEMKDSEVWRVTQPAPYYKTSLDGYGSSYFNRLWEEMGREIRFIPFIKGSM